LRRLDLPRRAARRRRAIGRSLDRVDDLLGHGIMQHVLSVPVWLRRSGREIRMVIDGTDPFDAAKLDARLIRLLLTARRFNAALADSEGVPFAARR
jgi:hypothetical protein